MIKLDVKGYCSECPDFEADVEKRKCELHVNNMDISEISGSITDEIITIVSCKKKKRCENLVRFLEKRR